MGNPKQKWTQEKEEALRQGVAKHGTGKWKDIQRDPEFNKLLFSRSNIDLKDKWRNMFGSGSGQGQQDKLRAKTKSLPDAAPLPNQPVIPITSVVDEAFGELAIDGSLKTVDETKSAPRYDDMIFQALSNLNGPNGSETGAMVSNIESQNCYKLKEDNPVVVKLLLKLLHLENMMPDLGRHIVLVVQYLARHWMRLP